jgi:hypothetical protein
MPGPAVRRPGAREWFRRTDTVRARFERDGFAFWNHPSQEGLPDYYRTGFHALRYVRRQGSRCFEVLDYLEDWAKIEEQDMIIRRRPAG